MAVLVQKTFRKLKNLCKKHFGECLHYSLLIPSDPGDFLAFNAFIVVSNSSTVIKSTQFSVNFARFPSVVLSLNYLIHSF